MATELQADIENAAQNQLERLLTDADRRELHAVIVMAAEDSALVEAASFVSVGIKQEARRLASRGTTFTPSVEVRSLRS